MINYSELEDLFIPDNCYDLSYYDYLTGRFLDTDSYICFNDIRDTCYLTSNEDLKAFMKREYFEGKRVATVGSSGDQMLDSLLLGAKDVTLIDANYYSRAFAEYKLAMVKNLNYEKFMVSLEVPRIKLFNINLYKEISHDLSRPVQEFWDRLFLEYQGEYLELDDFNYDYLENNVTATTISSELILFDENSGVNYIASKDNYLKLQEFLRKGDYKINFARADVSRFNEVLEGTFDVILLSNIYDYVDHYNFVKYVKELYNNKLNPGGLIQVHYAFVHDDYEKSDLQRYYKGLNIEIPMCDEGAYLLHKPRENVIEEELLAR